MKKYSKEDELLALVDIRLKQFYGALYDDINREDEKDEIKIQRLSGRFYANYYSILPKAGTFNVVSFE